MNILSFRFTDEMNESIPTTSRMQRLTLMSRLTRGWPPRESISRHPSCFQAETIDNHVWPIEDGDENDKVVFKITNKTEDSSNSWLVILSEAWNNAAKNLGMFEGNSKPTQDQSPSVPSISICNLLRRWKIVCGHTAISSFLGENTYVPMVDLWMLWDAIF